MLRKGPTSSAISSTTAQGFLPHYAGHAAASLSPTLTKSLASPSREMSPSKVSDTGDLTEGGASLSPRLDRHGENRHPKVLSSLEDQFKNLSAPAHAAIAASRNNLPTAFDL